MTSEESLDTFLPEDSARTSGRHQFLEEKDATSVGHMLGRRTNDDAPHTFTIKREVDVVKSRRAKFGVELQVFKRDMYVVGVTPNSIAWSIGIHLMDKLEAIDTIPVPRNADPEEILLLLNKPTKFVIKVVDNTAIATNHVLCMSPGKALGLVYMYGKVTEVMDNSVAALAGILPGMSIIGIRGKFAFGQNDASVLYMLKLALESAQEVEVTCMKSSDATQLIGAIHTPSASAGPTVLIPNGRDPAVTATSPAISVSCRLQSYPAQQHRDTFAESPHESVFMELDIADSFMESELSFVTSPNLPKLLGNDSESSLDLADAPIMSREISNHTNQTRTTSPLL